MDKNPEGSKLKEKTYTALQIAKMFGVSKDRIGQKIRRGHFPNSYICECGITRLIPSSDLELPLNKRKNTNEKDPSDNNGGDID